VNKTQKKHLDLQWQILIGITAGLLLGLAVNRTAGPGVSSGWLYVLKTAFRYGGDIFIRLLRMTIVPLVFASIFMSIVSLGNIRELRRIGAATVTYYLVTTALAVMLGIFLVNVIHPGRGIDPETIARLDMPAGTPAAGVEEGEGGKSSLLIVVDTLVGMIPDNPFEAMARADILQIIFFTILFAVVAALLGKEADSLVGVIRSLDAIMNRIIHLIMRIAPYCIFFLVTALMMDLGFSALTALFKYAFTVMLGLMIHGFVTLPLLVLLAGRYNPVRLFMSMLPAVLTAWSTASSVVTLPLTMECVENRAGVDRKISTFVLPLGATVNMDGTALYESVAVIFIAELLGIPLGIGTQLIIFLTATLAAIGAAAIPGAGLVTMSIVLTAAGVPLEGIGLILAIDRILDQFRTAVNVWGDAAGAVIVGRMEGNTNHK